MENKPYTIYTIRGYSVDLPDRDNEIRIDLPKEADHLYLSKEDVLSLLERFD